MPHLHQEGSSTQLIVDGHSLVMITGELHNSSSSSLDYRQPIWPKLVALNLNTVIASISWERGEAWFRTKRFAHDGPRGPPGQGQGRQ
jgi:hypothetical protein